MNWQKEHSLYEKNHWWFKSRREILINILEKIEISKKKSVIDFGCGNGTNLKFIFNNYKEKFGIEIDLFSFKKAKLSCPESTILNIDLNDLSNIKQKFNLVAILDVLYHEKIKNPGIILKKAYDLNHINGYIMISEPAFNILHGYHSKFVKEKRRFKKEELEKIILNLNYKIIFSSYWGISIFTILFIKRRIIEPWFFNNKKYFKSDLIELPLINNILYFIISIENKLMKYFKYPFGSSIIILAKKLE